MSNLIKNEFIKIFKKKSIYIVLFIVLIFIIASNFMYKNNENNLYEYYYGASPELIEYYEEDLNNLDPTDPSTINMYIDMKSQLDMMKLVQKYGNSSWQAHAIQNHLGSNGEIHIMNEYTYGLNNTITKEDYDTAKEMYDAFVKRLDNDDWRYFVKQELDSITASINSVKSAKQNTTNPSILENINSNLNSLEAQKQVLEWRLEKGISYEASFLNTALNRYSDFNQFIYEYENSNKHTYDEQQQYYSNLKQFNINKYYIENNCRNISTNDTRGILLNLCDTYELFIIIIIVMIAGSIVSDEFSKGTIKLLLVRPYSRVKILLAKFIVCILIIILTIVLLATLQFVVGGLIQGFESLEIPAVVYNFNTHQVETMNIASYIAITALAKFPMYLLLMTLAFACSTLFTNTAVSIVLPFLGYMASSIINQFALMYELKALLYFVTPNWDFTDYLFGGLPMFEGLTVPFSIVICLVYFLIMVVTMFTVFKKRNIKNV